MTNSSTTDDAEPILAVEKLRNVISKKSARIEFYARRNRKRYTALFLIQIGATVITTVILGLNVPEYTIWMKNSALILSATASFISLVQSRFRFREHQFAQVALNCELGKLIYRIDLDMLLDKNGITNERIQQYKDDFLKLIEKDYDENLEVLRAKIVEPQAGEERIR